ncbi:hypothetical protein TREES_T100012290 [Tupaia chinensis]|uniref:Uncharacterized protein n=1 Tax=Tupaia chinensis TaxID=246437 RepID=L9JJG4_TUPCH|nr:hypothetical protein TREES_T100012290 [Tupaia chinensis]
MDSGCCRTPPERVLTGKHPSSALTNVKLVKDWQMAKQGGGNVQQELLFFFFNCGRTSAASAAGPPEHGTPCRLPISGKWTCGFRCTRTSGCEGTESDSGVVCAENTHARSAWTSCPYGSSRAQDPVYNSGPPGDVPGGTVQCALWLRVWQGTPHPRPPDRVFNTPTGELRLSKTAEVHN